MDEFETPAHQEPAPGRKAAWRHRTGELLDLSLWMPGMVVAGAVVFSQVLLALCLLVLGAWLVYLNLDTSHFNHVDDIKQITHFASAPGPVSEEPQAWPSIQRTTVNQTCNGDELVCLQVTTMLPNSTLQELANIPVPPGSTSHYLVRVSVTPIDE